ncbi:MAG: diaminopropionate ammonia-lyase, partial [Pseudomonadota bacterium]
MPVSLVENRFASNQASYPPAHESTLDATHAHGAHRVIAEWPGYAPTPLRALPQLASAMGVGALHYKDEAGRFGLGSFKALGGAYAIYREIERTLAALGDDRAFNIDALLAGDLRDVTNAITVCSATDGNHGRSVAWGAQQFGCRAVIYIHETVSQGRADAIAAYGAEVIRNPGNYDEAVRRADQDAHANGWTVISDTSWPGYEAIPRDVMLGYTVMANEAIADWPGPAPTHCFVQGGVGGMAAAVCATLWWCYRQERPRCVVVEPETAACLYASATEGKRTMVGGDLETIMAGLSCGEPSLTAWPILRDACRWFATIDDDLAAETMRQLAAPAGDAPLVAGESAVAGLAACLALANDESLRAKIGLNQDARVLVFGTEGAPADSPATSGASPA